MNDWDGAEREAYLSLALVPGIGPRRLEALLRELTPSGALAAPLARLRAVRGFSGAAASAIARASRRTGADALAAARRLGGVLLLPGDPDFPAPLREIAEPPPFLFALGDLACLARPAVAIVGSRDHSAYGGEVARWLGRAAAEAGLAVVSGMARGLDALAHAGALDAGGATIGVLGNGLGVVYPAANRALYQAVSAHGLLLTEWPPGERPTLGAFPRRNRLISGLARVTVVVEAAQASGALQTVQCALDQGREVMAVPGPITSAVSRGTNGLLRDGCAPLLELGDLLVHYPEATAPAPQGGARAGPAADAPPADRPADPLRQRLRHLLDLAPRSLTELCAGAEAPPAAVLEALTGLELDGAVRLDPAGCYALAR